ncbi:MULTISPECIES: nitrate ABC transporter substrate-binding protein [unclassified Microbacterium]|uniref:nitrate ABC transporter substrate-binding protein n=1 Tax=unclassified Microbacterium TaxID=2609290 RepID=UPI0030172669
MTHTRPRLLTATATVGLAVLLLSGCAGTAAQAPTAIVGTDAPTSAPPEASDPTPADPSATPEDVTCDSLIDPDVLTDLQAQGWTAKETPFAAGGVTLSQGLVCTWANYTQPSGSILIFGWAPLTADQSTKMQSGLEGQGWIRKKDGSSLYITEDPAQAPTVDPSGYGMTYEFGDGWVTVGDLKQNLLLIRRPGA